MLKLRIICMMLNKNYFGRNGKFSAETDKLKKGKGRNGHFTFKENKTKR